MKLLLPHIACIALVLSVTALASSRRTLSEAQTRLDLARIIQLKHCVTDATTLYNPEPMKFYAGNCYEQFSYDNKGKTIKNRLDAQIENPLTCLSIATNNMWDFPEDASGEEYRTKLRECLALFPSIYEL